MRTTDRRARRAQVWNWGGLSLTYDDKLLMSAALTLTARYRRQPEDWPRLRWYARRLAIARRRQRIAEQPRVGDTISYNTRKGRKGIARVVQVIPGDAWRWTVVRVYHWREGEEWQYGASLIRSTGYWREAVRRAQVTQEGSEQ